MKSQTRYSRNIHLLLMLCTLPHFLLAQIENIPVVLEAEESVMGQDFVWLQDAGTTYVTITTNSAAGNPGSAARILSFYVTFPTAQDYDLYVRCRVGAMGADDDSFFYGMEFGEPGYTDGEWVRVNNISTTGYTAAGQVVDGGGGAGTGVWKWINLSEFTGDEPPVVFHVEPGQLSQIFRIGAREDGFDIDKIVFARADYFYTVSNLDSGEPGSPTNGGTSMDPIAAGKPKFLGNTYSSAQLAGFANYWNQVTPENAGKWGSVEASRDNMNWGQLDAAYALAKDNGFPFKLHVLIWGNQQPAWIESLPTSEQREEIEEWFQAIAARYADIDFIEVVNEPLHDPPNMPGGGNYINALGGSGSTGWDWVLEAFRLARDYFPGVQLMINDYNIINSISSTNAYIGIIELLQAENLVDAIGVQAHAFTTAGTPLSTMESNLNALAATGLPLYVTELDIDGPTDQVQLTEYQRVFPMLWEHPGVQGITLWGFRPGLWRQTANLIEDDGATERPALVWLRNYVEGTFVGVNEVERHVSAVVYPNPVNNGQFGIYGVDAVERARICDLTGRVLWTTALHDGNLFNLNTTLESGMYVIEAFDGTQWHSGKLLIP